MNKDLFDENIPKSNIAIVVISYIPPIYKWHISSKKHTVVLKKTLDVFKNSSDVFLKTTVWIFVLLKQRLNGVLTVLERRFNNSSIIREADLFSKR